MQSLAVNEFQGATFSCQGAGTSDANSNPFAGGSAGFEPASLNATAECIIKGSDVVQGQSMDADMLWPNVSILAGMAVFYFFVSFVLLTRAKRDQ